MAHHQVVGNIGMYYAAYRLSRRGWNVMPTSRNARGIDLLAYDAPAGRYLGIQVKALSKPKAPVPLGTTAWARFPNPTKPLLARSAHLTEGPTARLKLGWRRADRRSLCALPPTNGPAP
jgi:hypothetical protein